MAFAVRNQQPDSQAVHFPGAREAFDWSHYIHDRMRDHRVIDAASASRRERSRKQRQGKEE